MGTIIFVVVLIVLCIALWYSIETDNGIILIPTVILLIALFASPFVMEYTDPGTKILVKIDENNRATDYSEYFIFCTNKFFKFQN